jgi:hypothetical protein
LTDFISAKKSLQGKDPVAEVFAEAPIKIAQKSVCSGGAWMDVLAKVFLTVRLYCTSAPQEINASVLIDNGAPLQSYLKKIENNGVHHIKEAREHRCAQNGCTGVQQTGASSSGFSF